MNYYYNNFFSADQGKTLFSQFYVNTFSQFYVRNLYAIPAALYNNSP